MFNDRRCIYYVYALVSNEFLIHGFVRRQYDDIEDRSGERRYDLAQSLTKLAHPSSCDHTYNTLNIRHSLSVEHQSQVQARLRHKTHLEEEKTRENKESE